MRPNNNFLDVLLRREVVTLIVCVLGLVYVTYFYKLIHSTIWGQVLDDAELNDRNKVVTVAKAVAESSVSKVHGGRLQ